MNKQSKANQSRSLMLTFNSLYCHYQSEWRKGRGRGISLTSPPCFYWMNLGIMNEKQYRKCGSYGLVLQVTTVRLNHVVKRLCLSVCCVRGKRPEIMRSIDLVICVLGFTCLVGLFYNQGMYWNIQS